MSKKKNMNRRVRWRVISESVLFVFAQIDSIELMMNGNVSGVLRRVMIPPTEDVIGARVRGPPIILAPVISKKVVAKLR